MPDIDIKKFRVDPILTWEHGKCTKVQPLFSISRSQYTRIQYSIKFNSSLLEEDKPQEVIIYFTSNDTWQGVTDALWPQFKPSKATLKVDFDSNNWYTARTKEILHNEGVEDSEKCWLKQIQDFNCTIRCQFVNYTSTLPMCITRDQIRCMIDEIDRKNLWGICNQKKRGLYYDGELSKVNTVASNLTVISFSFAELSKEIKEEVDVITMSELIGSLGGSLGMFFGFSISANALFFFDKCIMKFMMK